MNLFPRFLLHHSQRGSDIPASDPFRVSEETTLKTTLQHAYAAPEVSPALQQRIAALAEQQNQQAVMYPRRSRLRGIYRVLKVFALLLVLAGLLAWPRLISALLFHRIQSAMRDAQNVTTTTYTVDADGTQHRRSQLTYQRGKWRAETGNNAVLQLCADGNRATYYKNEHVVTTEKAIRPVGSETMGGFALDANWGYEAIMGLLINFEKVSEYTVQQATWVDTLVKYRGSTPLTPRERVFLIVDARTDRPVQMILEHEDSGDWRTFQIVNFTFNAAYWPEYFTLNPKNVPQDVRRIDLEAERERWRQKLRHVVQQQRSFKSTIAIRDFSVNANGDVFLLYTAGHRPDSNYGGWKLELTDDLGNIYLPNGSSPFAPTVQELDGTVNGYVIDGYRLEGQFWMPLRPQQGEHAAPRPHRFTLTMYTQPSPYFHQDKANQSATVRFENLPRVECDMLLPTYMPYMARAPGGGIGAGWAIRYEEAWERATYYKARGDAQQALEWFNAVEALINEETLFTGLQRDDMDELMNQYELLSQLGRHADARAVLQKANTRIHYRPKEVEQIEAAMRREGLK